MKLSSQKHKLQFIKPARTSKIDYLEKEILLVSLKQGDKIFQGECAPLRHLSSENITECEEVLSGLDSLPLDERALDEMISSFPSALKFALQGIELEKRLKGKPIHRQSIKINGLIWMNGFDEMWNELVKKVEMGFDCIKIKVGQHDFDAECRFLERVRTKYGDRVELRLDANGAFQVDDVLQKLKDLNRFQIHSIEQPIQAGQWDAMEMVCMDSLIDIGIDEELIGVDQNQQESLLRKIKPQYLILKPTLHGGFDQCDQWVKQCQKINISWWATSALESNIGLFHIALWLSKYDLKRPQGLGTGSLFKENFKRPFYYEKDRFCWKD